MLPTPYSQDYLDLSSEIFSNGYGSGLVPFLGGCRGVTVVGGLGWVISRYWAASLLRLSCFALLRGFWRGRERSCSAGSQRAELNAAMVSFQYCLRCGGAGYSVGPLDSPVRWSGVLWLAFVNISQHCSIYCGLDVSR